MGGNSFINSYGYVSHIFVHVRSSICLQHILKGRTTTSGFSIWFLELFKRKKVVLSCPDSTVDVNEEVESSTQRADWLDLVKHEQVSLSMYKECRYRV